MVPFRLSGCLHYSLCKCNVVATYLPLAIHNTFFFLFVGKKKMNLDVRIIKNYGNTGWLYVIVPNIGSMCEILLYNFF